jgi:peptidoglycan/xylan/chitin deacetylase (PgdA/CDA1 family)
VVAGDLSEVDRRSSRLGRESFARQMLFLKEQYRVIDLDEHLDRLHRGSLDPACVSVTFDDAYAGVAEVAAPVLKDLEMPAAVFAISGTLLEPEKLLHYEELEAALSLTAHSEVAIPELGFPRLGLSSDKSRSLFLKRVKGALKGLPEQRRAHLQQLLLDRLEVRAEQLTVSQLPRARKMDGATLRTLQDSGLWTVGAHTRSHRVLSQLDPGDCREEIFGCRDDLTRVLEQAPRYLAYPYGKPEHVGELAPRWAAEAGFSASFSTVPGGNGAQADLHRLKRVEFIDLIALSAPEVVEKARQVFRR